MPPTLEDLRAQQEKMINAGASFAELAQINARIRDLAMGAAGTENTAPGEDTASNADDLDNAPGPESSDAEWEAYYMHLPPATPGQVEYAQTLARGLAHLAEGGQAEVDKTVTWLAAGARRELEMAGIIAELLVMADESRQVRPLDEAPTLPDGRYLLDGKLWQVSRTTVGSNAGVTLRPLADDGETAGPAIKYRPDKRAVLDALLADPATAARAYAKRFGKCGLCTEELTGVAADYAIHAGCLLRA